MCLVEHLALSIEGLGTCFYKEREQIPSVQLYSLSGMGRGKVPFPGKKVRTSSRFGPTQDIILSASLGEFYHSCFPKSGLTLPSSLPEGCDMCRYTKTVCLVCTVISSSPF